MCGGFISMETDFSFVMAMRKCPVCGVSVKEENLPRHVRNQHPGTKVEEIKELKGLRPARKSAPRDWRDDVARIGAVIAVAGVVWLILALMIPAPVGIIVPASPHLVILVIVGLSLLAVGWIMGSPALNRSWKKLVAIGLALGFILAGISALVASQQGVPVLDRSTVSEPLGWGKADNPVWEINNLPVVFYYGSAHCPFCAASSWAVRRALDRFGTLAGFKYWTTSADENSVAMVDLAHATFSSTYVSLDVKAGDDNEHFTAPSLSPVENAYLVTYDSNGDFPFYVVGGIYVRVGGLVDLAPFIPPGSGTASLTVEEVQIALDSGTGPVYSAVRQGEVCLEAYMVKACQAAGITPPAGVMQDSAVTDLLAQIT